MSDSTLNKDTSRRGFALLDRERQREIARSGGQAAHRKGAAHEFTADEAREAGRKGGLAISSNREHMARIGRNGGRARRGSHNKGASTDGNGHQNPENMVTHSQPAHAHPSHDGSGDGGGISPA